MKDSLNQRFNSVVSKNNEQTNLEKAHSTNRLFTPEQYFQRKNTDKENLPDNIFKNVDPTEIKRLRDKYCSPVVKSQDGKQYDIFED